MFPSMALPLPTNWRSPSGPWGKVPSQATPVFTRICLLWSLFWALLECFCLHAFLGQGATAEKAPFSCGHSLYFPWMEHTETQRNKLVLHTDTAGGEAPPQETVIGCLLPPEKFSAMVPCNLSAHKFGTDNLERPDAHGSLL